MAKYIKYKRLTELQKALLLMMSEQGLTPGSSTRQCYHIIMDFIERYGNYFCDSIHEIQRSLYSMSHDKEFKTPYIEARGDMGEIIKDEKGNERYTDGANMRYVECRMTQAGWDYIANNRIISKYSQPLNLLIQMNPIIGMSKRQEIKPLKLSELQEVLLLYMAKQGLWPNNPHIKCFNVVVGFIKNSGDFYTDSISSIIDALYDMSHYWMFDVPLVDMQGDTGCMLETYNNIIIEDVGANYLFTEARLSKAGLDYVISNNLISSQEK